MNEELDMEEERRLDINDQNVLRCPYAIPCQIFRLCELTGRICLLDINEKCEVSNGSI